MCGITGFFNTAHRYRSNELKTIVIAMADTLRHRGPDDGYIWTDADAGIALGHRRLSILDLSDAGRQPMHSGSGRYVIVFNGEIYNYREIRKELEAESRGPSLSWRGSADTEVMLAAFSHWGVEEAVKRFVGMFAFALWDRQDRVLYLVRDRIGEKPLYYGYMENTFLFGSELKALCRHPAWKGEINRDALTLFLRHNCIPAPYSIFKNIYKLSPGTILTIPVGRRQPEMSLPKPYWSAREIVERGIADPFTGSEAEAIEHLDSLLRATVRQQMAADVPLGAFLSGGVDSSTIVALMQAQSDRPVKSFTIGFHEEQYNEAEHAKAVARHLGTEHTELYITPADALAVIPGLPTLYDEPFSDASQIPTYLVSQLTRKHVTVSLSGDAGDELFAGYNRYFWGESIWRSIGWMPPVMKKASASLLTSFSPQTWEFLFKTLGPVLPNRLRQKNPADKVQKLSEVVNVVSPIDMYRKFATHWENPASMVVNSAEPLTALTDATKRVDIKDYIQVMMYLDLISFLPDDILAKVDRAAMGVSLETRVPFLDHRVVEFSWQIPLSMKIRNGQGKWLLRQVLYKYVPRELIERPKSGFAVPIDSWLRGPLREWAEDLMDEKRLREEGYLEPAPIRQKWLEHLSGKRNWQYHLWDVLMFQSWLANQARAISVASADLEQRCAEERSSVGRAPQNPQMPHDAFGTWQNERKRTASISVNADSWLTNPNGWLRRLFPTAHKQLLKKTLHSLALPDFNSVLVVGAGHDPYRSLFPRVKEYIRLDIKPIPGITDVVGDALALPFEADRFDCLFASEVLEHLSDPFLFAKEMTRVLKPGGTVILTVPFLFHKHGDPHDFWRPTDKALAELFKNFETVQIASLGNSLHVISDLITTAFTPYPVLFPLRIINHLLASFSKTSGASRAPSGYLVIARK
jgi:asparagine synthase (glutamine-hydrolysing)